MSRERLILIGAVAGAIIVLCVLGFNGSSSKQIDFAASLQSWASTVMRQDSTLKALTLGETSNCYAGLFQGESNILFLGYYERIQFTNESAYQTYFLNDTNGQIIDYKAVGFLLYTNVVQKLSLKGLETDSEGYALGLYIKPASNNVVSEVRFVGNTVSNRADEMVLRLNTN
jgi:hypothetical protein